jgi:plastocyanin
MKKIIVVLVVLFIGILFAGCTSQSSPSAATPTPTEVPSIVATAVPTPVPTAIPTTVVTPNMTANVTVNMTAVPTPVPTPANVVITFTQSLTVIPGATLNVPVGTTVVWFNNDPYKPHGIQSVGVQTGHYFGTVTIPYGKMFNVTFSQKGTYAYTTLFQPLIGGQIIVS